MRLPIPMLLVLASVLNGERTAAIYNVDFRNFSFPIPPKSERIGVPDSLVWLKTADGTTVTLVDGLYRFNKGDADPGQSVTLDEVYYSNLTSRDQSDAMVVLGYHTGGTANWNYVYAFSFSSEQPKLLGWFATGDRAESGLYHLFPSNGQFSVDLFDPDPLKHAGDCCSSGFIRTTYKWRRGTFIRAGPDLYGRVEHATARRKGAHR